MNFTPKRFDFSIPVRINLYSDTQSKPTPGMKDAMLNAEVGDEQGGSDPTVWDPVRSRRGALLGKEAAMFLPSGTMCNQVAIATHCRPGDEILAHEDAHIQSSEGGAPGAISGVMIKGPARRARPVQRGDAGRRAIRPVSRYSPPQKLVEVEQTANKGGGTCWPVAALRDVAEARIGTAWRCTWTARG
jgi:threonine aldolase